MEVGSQYILSAVMHADERNRALSEELGRDVYHYHLHVIYIPVVDKEVRWTKKCKDKALVGTVKEVIHQISHSKKWAFMPIFDEQGKPILNKSGKPVRIPSYSLLQDRFFEYMQDAGYSGFERGVRGSTDENLDTLAYKIKQDTERLARINAQIAEKETTLGTINQELAVVKPIKATFDEISVIGKKKRLSDKVEMSTDDYDKLQNLAKEGLTAQMTTEALNQQMGGLRRRIWAQKEELDNLYAKTKDFITAMRLAPEKVNVFISDIAERKGDAVEHKHSKWSVKIGGHDAR